MIHPVREKVFEWLKSQKDAMTWDGDRVLICKKGFVASLVNGAKLDLEPGDAIELKEEK